VAVVVVGTEVEAAPEEVVGTEVEEVAPEVVAEAGQGITIMEDSKIIIKVMVTLIKADIGKVTAGEDTGEDEVCALYSMACHGGYLFFTWLL
jgi:hypothetical protein